MVARWRPRYEMMERDTAKYLLYHAAIDAAAADIAATLRRDAEQLSPGAPHPPSPPPLRVVVVGGGGGRLVESAVAACRAHGSPLHAMGAVLTANLRECANMCAKHRQDFTAARFHEECLRVRIRWQRLRGARAGRQPAGRHHAAAGQSATVPPYSLAPPTPMLTLHGDPITPASGRGSPR
jgi:hypothetical protein